MQRFSWGLNLFQAWARATEVETSTFPSVHSPFPASLLLLPFTLFSRRMSDFTPSQKHHILTQYQSRTQGHTFAALAQQYGVKGGRQTIAYWYTQWDGSPASLQHKPGAGRPRLLTRSQTKTLITQPIRNKRRAHEAVHYTDIIHSIQQKSGTMVSIQTVRRYGRKEAEIKQKTTRKRTAAEGKQTQTLRNK